MLSTCAQAFTTAEWGPHLTDAGLDRIAHLVTRYDTPRTTSRIQRESAASSSTHLDAASGTSVGSGGKRRRAAGDPTKPRKKKSRDALSSQIESAAANVSVVGDAEEAEDAEDAEDADKTQNDDEKQS